MKEFADVPLLPLDRHRILLILINLISNAKCTMDGVPERHHQITLQSGQPPQPRFATCSCNADWFRRLHHEHSDLPPRGGPSALLRWLRTDTLKALR